MEILFGNRGIYHYLDAKVGTKSELEADGKWYQIQMLIENELPYIFPAAFVCRDGEVWLSHNTQNCYALYSFLQKKTMDGIWLKRILKQIAAAVRQMESYLLDAKDLVIQVEYLFYKDATQELRMICVPGYQKPLKEQLCGLLEYLMPRFNHMDREGERFLYECYQLVADEWKDITYFLSYVENEDEIGMQTGVAESAERSVGMADKIGMQTGVAESAERSVGMADKIGMQTDATGSAEQSMETGDFSVVGTRGHARRTFDNPVVLNQEVDTIFSKRFFLFALGGGAALALIIKYLFFDGTTLTAIFGIVWLLALLVLAIMTIREKEEDADLAMQEYKFENGTELHEIKAEKALQKGELGMGIYEIRAEKKMTERELRTGLHETKAEKKVLEGEAGTGIDESKQPSGHAKLVPLTNGAMEPLWIVPSQSVYTIGRDKHVDYRVTTTQISRLHAKLKNKTDGLYLEDCGSTNGTFVNEKRLLPEMDVKLVRGDIVGFANEEFFLG